jgi:hypothetical protein
LTPTTAGSESIEPSLVVHYLQAEANVREDAVFHASLSTAKIVIVVRQSCGVSSGIAGAEIYQTVVPTTRGICEAGQFL